MKVSVIISTYNSEEWLEKVLYGYSVQTENDFELIIFLIERLDNTIYKRLKHPYVLDIKKV